MILVTMKGTQAGLTFEDRIMQVHPDTIASLQDLREGGCRIFLRDGTSWFEVEESVRDIAIALRQEDMVLTNAIRAVNSNAMEAFERMMRMMGWSVLALGAIAVLMVFLVVMR